MNQTNRLHFFCRLTFIAILLATCLPCAPSFGQLNKARPNYPVAPISFALDASLAGQPTRYPGGDQLRIPQPFEATSNSLKQVNFIQPQPPQANAPTWPDGASPVASPEMTGEYLQPDGLPFVFRLNHRLENVVNQAPVPRFDHPDANDPLRHVGRGQPLYGTSWLNRPYHIGWFVGALFGDELVGGRVDQGEGLFGGYRIGVDFDHYWGWEGRFAFSNVNLIDLQSPPVSRTSRDIFWDVSLVYYPWGDARWRPYALLGVGLANFHFEDEFQQDASGTSFHMPVAIGFKYYWKNWLALRWDLTGNLAFGSSELDSMFNGSFTFGLEMHYGAKRRTYYPWNPALRHW